MAARYSACWKARTGSRAGPAAATDCLAGKQVNTLTLDNGQENRQHRAISAATGAHVYFADPYSSWQKGSVEHANKLLRRYLPKGCDLGRYTQAQINAMVHSINNKPRRCLGYWSALELADKKGVTTKPKWCTWGMNVPPTALIELEYTCMKIPPTPRPRVYELYWYFAAERQRIFERRTEGLPAPWSDDPILCEYKFCNVYRAADRVSQYMIREVCYHNEPCSPEDRLFQIVAFRSFSKIETWNSLRQFLGHHPTLDDLANGSFTAGLEYTKAHNGGLYTGAFILCAADAYGQPSKYRNHVELFRHMFLRDNLGSRLLEAKSLQQIYNELHCYPLIGDFMAYQIAIDLNYSTLINFSENGFTQAGPGALRGIKKCFESLGDYTPAETISWMVDHQADEFDRLGLSFHGLWGRSLHAIDCQGLFCETDKYCRAAIPELASARKRIKARFTPTPEPVRLFFPPKWGINGKLPSL